MTAKEQAFEQARRATVEWAFGRAALHNHIVNGVCRGLYSNSVANGALRLLDKYEQELVELLSSTAKEL